MKNRTFASTLPRIHDVLSSNGTACQRRTGGYLIGTPLLHALDKACSLESTPLTFSRGSLSVLK